MKPLRWPHFVLSCRVDLFRAHFQLEMWAASASVFAENSLSQLWDSVPSSKIFLLWLWKTVHCGPHAPPLSRSFKRPLCMSFWKMCNIRQQGFSTLCEFTIREVLQNLSSHWNMCQYAETSDHWGVVDSLLEMQLPCLPGQQPPQECALLNLLPGELMLRAKGLRGPGMWVHSCPLLGYISGISWATCPANQGHVWVALRFCRWNPFLGATRVPV